MKKLWCAAAVLALVAIGCSHTPTPDEVDACRARHAYKLSIQADIAKYKLQGPGGEAVVEASKKLLGPAQEREDELCKGVTL